MSPDIINITKANVHNLKKINVKIPKNSLCVITGPSGSGKSSLAFDTIYIEGQRRYIESLSSYARQFLGQFQPPDVESISGLSPAIAISQKSVVNNPRSTVGTITEIYDYMRVLYARVGNAYCPESGEQIESQSAQQIVNTLTRNSKGSKLTIFSQIIKKRKGAHCDLLNRFSSMGFSRIRLNGNIVRLDDNIKISKNNYHDIDLIIDRIIIKEGIKSRLTDSTELALKIGNGHMSVLTNNEEKFFSEKNFSAQSGKSYPDLEPRLFSFNSPLGACENCKGIGILSQFTEAALIPNPELSLFNGASPYLMKNSFLFNMIKCIAEKESVDLSKPFKSLPQKIKKTFLNGSKETYLYSFESENTTFRFKKPFIGIFSWLEKKYKGTSSEKIRKNLEAYMNTSTCSHCNGLRLKPFSLSVLISKKNIMDISNLPVEECLNFFLNLKLTGNKKKIAEKLIKEIVERLSFLQNVGLSYLSLDRPANTLSGGEAQRIRLATQIGSALSGVIYVLDEPSIGLHQKDNLKLIKTIKNLRDLGNTVIVVEHDEETIREADHIIDIGPAAGTKGGKIIAQGTLEKVLQSKKSITARYLNKSLSIEVPSKRRPSNKKISLYGAKANNLKSIDVQIPLNNFVCITGVSGSGKSTLIHNILVPGIKKETLAIENTFSLIKGDENIDSIIRLDQSPIGRTPKSNPATYSGLFNLIRTLFSNIPESKARGYKQGRFSFNVKNGRCETCEGNGVLKIEMHFLPDVFIKCSQCDGKRYNQETLNILYRGHNISDVLYMTVGEAKEFFANHKKINQILSTLSNVGLDYLTLGQSSTTLSGGEAQRLKLAKELAKSTKGHCLYVLDEPTTGLHFSDINILITTINSLIDQGNSVLIIEHNLDIIKMADYIIDLGPEGGERGGEVIFSGTPEEIVQCRKSYTGKYLKKYL